MEGADRVLPSFPPDLSVKAERALSGLGVRTRTHTTVTDLDPTGVTVRTGDAVERIPAKTVLWAAGVQASGLGKIVSQRTGAPLDRAGRLVVGPVSYTHLDVYKRQHLIAGQPVEDYIFARNPL